MNTAAKRLFRSKSDKMIAGVCGGLGQYFNIDPVIVRLIFAFSAFTGAGILTYIILWIVVPEEKNGAAHATQVPAEKIKDSGSKTKTDATNKAGGIILVVLGLVFLSGNYLPWFAVWHLWPLLVVILGIVLIAQPQKK